MPIIDGKRGLATSILKAGLGSCECNVEKLACALRLLRNLSLFVVFVQF